MLEKEIEKALVRAVKKAGGKCLKAPGKKPRALQIKRMKQLMELGFLCFVIDGIEQIGGVMDAVCSS